MLVNGHVIQVLLIFLKLIMTKTISTQFKNNTVMLKCSKRLIYLTFSSNFMTLTPSLIKLAHFHSPFLACHQAKPCLLAVVR